MSPFVYHPADAELVRRILAETRVATKPASPSLVSYGVAWIQAVMRWIAERFAERPGLASGILNVALIAAVLTVALALALLVLSIVRRLPGRAARGPSVPSTGAEGIPADAPLSRDRLAWRAEVETRLSRGDIPGALEAFWWWLALSLPLESTVEPSWTTRELLLRARRRELLGLGRALDVLMYGSCVPLPEDVTACLARFEEKLA